MKNRSKYITDIVCLAVVVAAVGAVAVYNLVQPNRPTVSETENRELAKMPSFSLESLADGSYFKGISAFYSDTFMARDNLVDYSKRIDTLKGFDYSLNGENSFVLIGDRTAPDSTAEPEDDTSDKLAEALEKLNSESEAPKAEPQPQLPEETEDKKVTYVVANHKSETISSETDAERVKSLSLSKDSLKLSVGSGAVLTANVETDDGVTVYWLVSDPDVASLSVGENGVLNLKAVGAGECTVTCYAGKQSAQCAVTVNEINTVNRDQANDAADFLTDGLFIYGDAVYTQGAYSATYAKNYVDTALYYKNLFGANTRVSIVVAPVSSVVIDNPEITSKIPNQKAGLANMAALCDSSVNFVDTYTEIYNHRTEYLYFKTDHHWTQRGAYYAYVAFAKSVGFEPTPLEDFDYELKSENYQGSMYSYTRDDRVKNFYDSVEAFVSRKAHTMTVTERSGATVTYDTSVVSFNKTYISFIAGDNPYTVINVPENPQDKNVLVLKDSFGNAFVPFLCEHYGNIIVADARYYALNLYDELKDFGITDVIFINNIQAANSPAWSRLYLAAVGVE